MHFPIAKMTLSLIDKQILKKATCIFPISQITLSCIDKEILKGDVYFNTVLYRQGNYKERP